MKQENNFIIGVIFSILAVLLILFAGCTKHSNEQNTDTINIPPSPTTSSEANITPTQTPTTIPTQPMDISYDSPATPEATPPPVSDNPISAHPEIDMRVSTINCVENSETGKKDVCSCIINANKNKFTVIIKDDGIYDNAMLRQKLDAFLGSVKKDLAIENTGISYFQGNSLKELDTYIEKLYYEHEVSYIIYVGDELNLKDVLNDSRSAWEEELPLVGKKSNLDKETLNPDALCKDVAISWILPPSTYSDKEKVDFVGRAIDTYTRYHNNENNILGDYSDDHLHIQWDNNVSYADYGSSIDSGADDPDYDPVPDQDYLKNIIVVLNSDKQKVEEELRNKHYLWSYHVHGSFDTIGIGLPPRNGYRQSPYVYLNDFAAFVDEIGTPALLVQSAACGGTTTNLDNFNVTNYCCWPQRMIDSGVWAYYSHGYYAGQFIGSELRHNPTTQTFVFGDITAHFRKQ